MASNIPTIPPSAARPVASQEAGQDDSSALAFLRSESPTTFLLEKLERMIMGADLKAGERNDDLVLARAFGVRRSPIRAACRKLDKTGRLETLKHRGLFLCRHSCKPPMVI